MARIFGTNYAALGVHAGGPVDPVWAADGIQAGVTSRLSIGKDEHGWYQRHECRDGELWNGSERCDVMTRNLNSYMIDGQGKEFALAWDIMLEPGFNAGDDGFSCICDVHDNRGSIGGKGTQPIFQILATELGVTFIVNGGNPGPNAAGDFHYKSPRQSIELGTVHRVALSWLCASDKTKGHFRFALDGKVIADQAGSTAFVGGSNYWKQAYYRNPNVIDGTHAVRHYDLIAYAGEGCWEEALGTPPPPPTAFHYNSSIADQAKLSGTERWTITTDDPNADKVEFYADNALITAVPVLGGGANLDLHLPETSKGGGFHVLTSNNTILHRSPTINWTVTPVAVGFRVTTKTEDTSRITLTFTSPETGDLVTFPLIDNKPYLADGKMHPSEKDDLHEITIGKPQDGNKHTYGVDVHKRIARDSTDTPS